MSTTWRFKLDDFVFFPDSRSGGFIRGMIVALPRLSERVWRNGCKVPAGYYVLACEDDMLRAVDVRVLREGANNFMSDRTVTRWSDGVWQPKHLRS